MTELLSCPFCGGEVGFHKDEDCNGCHYIWCHSCDGMFDLSAKADPENDTETLEELNERIAPIWNNRAQQSAPAGLIERDTLRKQLDEANSAYARLADGVPAAMAKYHKCKKQLDEARKQLDEARELLVEPQRFPSSKWADKWQVQRDAWLEKTK